ncbi:MAG: TonB-dependent receptor [Emcibacter sp.]|nr:TonB-dependent receptor [Emcibacter sp.]
MKSNFTSRLKFGVSAITIAATLPFSIQASYAAEDADKVQLEEITVTSRKKQELLVNVPMNIAVVGSVEIQKRNLINKEDFYRTVAGASSPRGQLILRGLSGGNDSTPDTTTTFIDGVPGIDGISSDYGGGFSFSGLFDVERVEVLRGPQGTLWGSNAIGGTVQIITNAPNLTDIEVFGSTVFESEKNRNGVGIKAYGGFNLPIIEDKLALRIVGNTSHREGKMYNSYTGTTGKENQNFIRAQLLWQPEEDTRVKLGYIHNKDFDSAQDSADRSVPGYHYEAILTANPDATYGYDVALDFPDCTGERSECFGAPLDGHNPKFSYYALVDSYADNESHLVSLNVEKDNIIDGVDVTYVGSYSKYDYAGRQGGWSRLDAQDLFRTWIIDKDGATRFTHELRLQSNDEGPLEWTVGAFYDKSKGLKTPENQWQYHANDDKSRAIAAYLWGEYWGYGVDPTQLGIDLYGDGNKNYNYAIIQNDSRELALFGEVSYTFELDNGSKFEITGGLRYFDLKDEAIFEQSGIWIDLSGAIDRSETLGDDGKESGTRKKLALAYMPNEELSFFAIYSEGYRPGGNNGASAPAACSDDPAVGDFVDRYKSDSIKNYEIGVKGFAAERRIQFSAAAYQIDWTGVQSEVYMATCGFSYNSNFGAARSKGIEFESTSLVTDTLKLIVNGSYTKSTMLTANAALGIEAGEDMTMVPKYNFYVALDQELEIYGREASVRFDVNGYGKNQSHFNTRLEDTSEAYVIANISAGVQLTDNARVSFHISNLFNKDYTTFKRARSRNPNWTGGALDTWYGDERTLAVRLDFKL